MNDKKRICHDKCQNKDQLIAAEIVFESAKQKAEESGPVVRLMPLKMQNTTGEMDNLS